MHMHQSAWGRVASMPPQAAVCDHTNKRIFPPSIGGLDGAIAAMLDSAQVRAAPACLDRHTHAHCAC